jgi:hypothetical protein
MCSATVLHHTHYPNQCPTTCRRLENRRRAAAISWIAVSQPNFIAVGGKEITPFQSCCACQGPTGPYPRMLVHATRTIHDFRSRAWKEISRISCPSRVGPIYARVPIGFYSECLQRGRTSYASDPIKFTLVGEFDKIGPNFTVASTW